MKNQMENWLEELQDIINEDEELSCNAERSTRIFELTRTCIEDKGMKARNRLEIESYVAFFKELTEEKR